MEFIILIIITILQIISKINQNFLLILPSQNYKSRFYNNINYISVIYKLYIYRYIYIYIFIYS